MIWVTQPVPKQIPSLSDLSNTTGSERKYTHWVIWVTSTRSERNTHLLRFPYTHAYQYNYRIPRECKTNNELIKVICPKSRKKCRKKPPDPLAKWNCHPMVLPGGPNPPRAGQDGSHGGRELPLFRRCRTTGLIIYGSDTLNSLLMTDALAWLLFLFFFVTMLSLLSQIC